MDLYMNKETFVIAGGTSGVAKQVVIELVKAGNNVVFGDIGTLDDELITTLSNLPGNAHFIPTDVTAVADCEYLFQYTYLKYGSINGFFSYSGITPAQSLLDCTETVHDNIFNVNVKGAMFCSKYAVEYMIKSGGGSIVFTGSPHAWAGEFDRVSYACSKGAIITLSDHIAKNYGKYNIRANYITLGWTPTEGELKLRASQGISENELRRAAAAIVPMGRMNEIEDVVPSILFLLSNKSKMVSGSNIRITGGWFM